MAFNPSPKVAAAREIGKQFGVPVVVVLMVNQESGILEYASYGETRVECNLGRELADVAFEAVQAHLGGEIPEDEESAA
jgi:hypothetical protein